MVSDHEMRMEALRLFEENGEELREFVKSVDSWVSNPRRHTPLPLLTVFSE